MGPLRCLEICGGVGRIVWVDDANLFESNIVFAALCFLLFFLVIIYHPFLHCSRHDPKL